MRRSNKLRSSSSNGPRTASTYSYTGLNNTDGDSTFSGRNNNNNNFLSATSMQVEMPAMTSALDPEPPATNAGTQGMYGSWYGGRPAPVLPSPSMYVEPPPEQHSSSAPGNTLRPGNLRPGSRFGHGTPLAQISEGSTPASTTRPPIPPPTPGPELRNPYDTGNNLAVSDMHVEMPTLSPADPLTGPAPVAPPPSTSTTTSTLPSTRTNTPATTLINNSYTAANVIIGERHSK
ncbi:hypothetical protein ONZ45_g1625 [Pleurotus djamor]|nr:hypothetical protein ONZ45_g1625 [Pleurotus djamor]